MKRLKLPILIVIVAFVVSVMVTAATAADTAKKTVTITGTSSCGGCSGVVKGCCVLLTDKDGIRWVLRGDNKSLKAAFKVRHDSKTMTATLAGTPVTKKGKDGKDYKEVKVSKVTIGS